MAHRATPLRGARRRAAVAALVLPSVLAACGTGDVVRVPQASAPAAAARSSTNGCHSAPERYAVRFPTNWFTVAGRRIPPCRFFHPERFVVPAASEAVGVAVRLQVAPTDFDVVTASVLRALSGLRVVDQRTGWVGGRRAMRIETLGAGHWSEPAGRRTTTWYVDWDGGTFVGTTSDGAASGGYADNVDVLDAMIGTVERFDAPYCSVTGLSAPISGSWDAARTPRAGALEPAIRHCQVPEPSLPVSAPPILAEPVVSD